MQPLLPLQASIFDGANVGFVSAATGRLAFAVTDLDLPGATPLAFQRTYASDRDEDTGLGRGWSFVFNDRITIDGDVATLTTADGAAREFNRDGQTSRFRLRTPEPGNHQEFQVTDAATIIEQSAELTRTYRKNGAAYRLSRIAFSNLLDIEISHDARGRITRIANSSGSTLALEWSNEKDARLVAVADNGGRRIAFRQTGHTLRAFTDAAGAEWQYDYAGGRLTRAADPVGRVLLRARYDRDGHTIEAGDAVGMNRYDYEFASAISHRTTITDALGAATAYEHTERGALASIGDDEGGIARLEYNAANRPTRIADSLGGETKFVYDNANRLLRQVNADGTEKAFVTEPTTQTDATRGYATTYNGRGQLTSIKSDKREMTFEYDARGNETAFVYSDVGRFEKSYDAAGRAVTERLPSGLTYRNEYDARGWLAKRSDTRGRSLRVERDASGVPVAYVRADGKRTSAVRDEAGRVIAVKSFDGKTRRMAYDARGALTDFVDERGRHRKYEYDRRGRLRAFTNSAGVRRTVDAQGRVRPAVASNRSASGARFVKASYAPTIKAAQDECPDPNGCYESDEVINIDTWVAAYRGSWGGGAWDLIPECEVGIGDEAGGGGGETREECVARRAKICADGLRDDITRIWTTAVFIITLDAVLVIAAAFVSAGTAAVPAVILGGLAAVGVIGLSAIEYSNAIGEAQRCMLDIPDLCRGLPQP